MTPCFLLAPWVNSRNLSRATERIQEAYPDRDYFLDIDRHYDIDPSNTESSVRREFFRLKDPSDRFLNWTNFVKEHAHVLPCVQMKNQSAEDIRIQVERYREMGRKCCLRISRDVMPMNMDEILDVFSTMDPSEFAVILDGGWAEDSFQLAFWFKGLISDVLKSVHPGVPIVVSCTSSPKSFSSMTGITRVAFSNRILYQQLKVDFSSSLAADSYEIRETSRNLDSRAQGRVALDGSGAAIDTDRILRREAGIQLERLNLIYGDWGSTRARDTGQMVQRLVPRIDYPTIDAWYIARNEGENWNFQEAAIQIIQQSGVWAGNLGIWGEIMIQRTTIHEKIGIYTPQRNVAARVNMHLHRQAFFDEPDLGALDLDEDWVD